MNASHLMHTYSPQPVTFARGDGAWLWDTEGKKYLDGLAGIAVNGLGHNHPVLTKALQEQVARLIHTSNLFRVAEQERAAAKVCAIANMDNAFFANSGAEANEAAIKLARLHGHQRGIENATIVVMEKAWHGRAASVPAWKKRYRMKSLATRLIVPVRAMTKSAVPSPLVSPST
jgi:acetylornithine aminotransferase